MCAGRGYDRFATGGAGGAAHEASTVYRSPGRTAVMVPQVLQLTRPPSTSTGAVCLDESHCGQVVGKVQGSARAGQGTKAAVDTGSGGEPDLEAAPVSLLNQRARWGRNDCKGRTPCTIHCQFQPVQTGSGGRNRFPGGLWQRLELLAQPAVSRWTLDDGKRGGASRTGDSSARSCAFVTFSTAICRISPKKPRRETARLAAIDYGPRACSGC